MVISFFLFHHTQQSSSLITLTYSTAFSERIKVAIQGKQPTFEGFAIHRGGRSTSETPTEMCARQRSREARVSKTMTSNGVAPREEATADILREMHPKDLVLPMPEGPQLTTNASDCHSRMMRAAGSIAAVHRRAPPQGDHYFLGQRWLCGVSD